MDFLPDQLADGTNIRLLTIIDIYSRESLAIVVGQRLRGDVVAALNHIDSKRPAPKCLFVDNGSEFSGQLLDLWAYHHQAKIDFSRPGKPTDNFHRDIQRLVTRRMPERALVRIAGRGQDHPGGLAPGLQ